MADGYSAMYNSTVVDGDYEEEDIWPVVKENEDSSPKIRASNANLSSSSSAWRLNSAPRMIPRSNIVSPPPPAASQQGNGVQQSSAPVNIPDWSKIYGRSKGMGSWSNYNDDGAREDHGLANGNVYHYNNYNNDADIDENEDEEDGMVPPYEWIAKKLARSQISSFSVCEGIGRTLKGRDLSKVRNAILTKTGFLE